MAFLDLVAIVVHDYDPAIRFFVDILDFKLVEGGLPCVAQAGLPLKT